MVGLKTLIRIWLPISGLVVIALVVTQCARKPVATNTTSEQTQTMLAGGESKPASKVAQESVAVDINSMTCGELLKEYSATLNSNKVCKDKSECTYMSAGPTGCWIIYNKSAQERITALGDRLGQPRCRLFYPMFKCAGKPGEADCVDGTCGWTKPGSEK